MIKEKKHCEICGRLFEPQNKREKYCSTKCRRKARARAEKKRWDKKVGSKTSKRCKQCKKLFTPSNRRQLYCTKDCERKAAWKKQSEERDLVELKESVRKYREKQVKHVYGPVIDVSGRHGSCVFDEESYRGTNEGLGSVNIPHPPSGDASDEEWKQYHKRLQKELKKSKKG